MLVVRCIFHFSLAIMLLLLWCGGQAHAQLIVPPCEKTPIFIPEIPPCKEGGYKLMFAEEFDGEALDTNVWQIQQWRQGSLGDETTKSYLSIKNAVVKDGICTIEARKEDTIARAVFWESDDEVMEDGKPNLRQYEYTGSSIWTIPKFRYGKYEARCRQPDAMYVWPAFWMYGGPIGNEIDVFDSYGKPGEFITGVGYGYDGNIATQGCHKRFSNVADFTQWHVFTCTYSFDRIVWEIDGVPIRTFFRYSTFEGQPIECGDEIGYGTILQQNAFPHDSMSIILTMGFQSGDKGPNASSTFPQRFEIDYVRFYEFSENAEEQNLKVYPNPASDQLTIVAEAQMDKVSIFNAMGQLVWFQETMYKGNYVVDIRSLHSGIYFVRAITHGRLSSTKLVKK